MARLKDSRRFRGAQGVVYLLHLERPLKHARHYIGWTQQLDERMKAHRAGRGSKLLAAAVAMGIDFVIARTWTGDLFDERVIHRQHNSKRLCPICNPGAVDAQRSA